MLRVTEKGKELIAQKKGIIKIQNINSGDYDYSSFDSWDAVFEEWAKEIGGLEYYEGLPKDDDPDSVYTAEESKERCLDEFKVAMFETSIDECLENGDKFGVGVKFGYLEDVDEE